jgi:AcrR family transcriptional regulator
MIYLDYTVDRIKKSATKIFYEKGFNGARVNEIAKDAEVSKSLLHYYFRTKEHLFKIVVDESIDRVVKNMSPILTKDLDFFELINQFIYNILFLFKDNKKLLSFIINEYNQNFGMINSELKPIILFFKEFENKTVELSQKEKIKLGDIKHFIVNIISLCGWQVIGINIFSLEKTMNDSSNSFNISEIKENIYKSIISSIKE